MRFFHFGSFRIQLGLWWNIEGFSDVRSIRFSELWCGPGPLLEVKVPTGETFGSSLDLLKPDGIPYVLLILVSSR